MEKKKNQIVDTIVHLLSDQQPGMCHGMTDIALLAGDGSSRIFYRLLLDNDTSIVAVYPNNDNPLGQAEAASAWHICGHLRLAGIAVPEPLAYDRQTGVILFEDLGDVRMYDLLQNDDCLREDCRFKVYRKAVQELVRMQVEGKEKFDVSWCWQTSRYDRELMLERESGYFLQSLCRDFLKLEPDLTALHREFGRIADAASTAPSDFFLHRDFQCRNIMMKDDAVRIIDFQGGRLGPLGYDLASLLIDPYVRLSLEFQEAIFDEYLCALLKRVRYDPHVFREEYGYLAMQRNLQILGAFAFLGKQKGKTFFLSFIHPALVSMQILLRKDNRDQYPVLTELIDTCREKIEQKNLCKPESMGDIQG